MSDRIRLADVEFHARRAQGVTVVRASDALTLCRELRATREALDSAVGALCASGSDLSADEAISALARLETAIDFTEGGPK